MFSRYNKIIKMITLIVSVSLLVPLSLVAIFKFLNVERKPRLFGVYQQGDKTFWPKFAVMYIFLRSRQLITHLRRLRAVDVGRSDDGTIEIHEQDAPLENKYNLGHHPLAVDAVYFNGMSKEGAALICAVARRAEHNVDAFMYLKIDGEDLLVTPSYPDTHLTQIAVEYGQYKADGIAIDNYLPMRAWAITYNGEMKTKNTDMKKKIELKVTWSAHFSHFNYDHQMSPLSMAKDMAREAWSGNFFELVKKFHQTHYEQMGYLEGTVSIDGVIQNISMPCVRNHSFGNNRDWRNFRRYALHFLYLDNGDCLAVGSVSQPATLSHLTIGYLCRKADQVIFPVEECDFKLYHHGENQVLPKDYGFIFKAGGELYAVKVLVNDEDYFYIGKDREAKIYERWSSVEVNGVKGWGCGEWHFNNTHQWR